MTTFRFFRASSIECSALTWRLGDRSIATIVLKCTLGIDENRGLVLVHPDAIVSSDIFIEQNPAHALRDASDLVPYLGRGEVLFFGDAFGQSGTRSHARLCVRSPSSASPEVLVDKKIVVSIPPSRSPMGRVSVSYENAFGGLGNAWNPVGRPDPLLVHATAPQFPAGMGPLPRSWRVRSNLLRPEDKKGLRAEELQIFDGFNWAFFHAAPPDQRAGRHFHGDEIIDLEGLWPTGGRVQLELPHVRAEARLLSRNGNQNIPIQADLMRIDADRQCVSLTFRGTVPIMNPLERMYIGAGVAVRGAPIQWPEWELHTIEDFEDADTVGPMSERASDELEETASAIRLDELRSRTLPFKAGPPDPMSSQQSHTALEQPSFPKPAANTLLATDANTVELPALRLQDRAPRAQPEAEKPPARDFGVVDLGSGLGAELLLAMVERVKTEVGSP